VNVLIGPKKWAGGKYEKSHPRNPAGSDTGSHRACASGRYAGQGDADQSAGGRRRGLDRVLCRRNAGYSWGDWDATGVVIGPSGGHKFNVDGFIGGLQAGYNWQFNPKWLIGTEGDYQWSGEKDDFTWIFPIVIGDARSGFTIKNEMKFPWFAMGRARIGYLPDPNWLLFATGGVAIGRVETNALLTLGLASASASDATTKTGWTVGAGVEAKLGANSHWSAKLEYLYIDLGTVDFYSNAVSIKVRDNIARFGINYKF
jgi:outer membrane immunogenic protein